MQNSGGSRPVKIRKIQTLEDGAKDHMDKLRNAAVQATNKLRSSNTSTCDKNWAHKQLIAVIEETDDFVQTCIKHKRESQQHLEECTKELNICKDKLSLINKVMCGELVEEVN